MKMFELKVNSRKRMDPGILKNDFEILNNTPESCKSLYLNHPFFLSSLVPRIPWDASELNWNHGCRIGPVLERMGDQVLSTLKRPRKVNCVGRP